MLFFKHMIKNTAKFVGAILVGFLVNYSVVAQTINDEKIWSFKQTIATAQHNDPWLSGNKYQQQAKESLSRAAKTMPDPKMSIGIANLPTNGFDFSQEAMTQVKVGITQMFPRGDSLALHNQQLRIESEAYPLQRQDRKAKVAVTVGTLWLDAYQVQQSISLIEQNRSLFEQLADVAQANYSSALGKTRQQDIVRAQLELTRLDDRLDRLAQQQNAYLGQLSQWLSNAFSDYSDSVTLQEVSQLDAIKLQKKLPQLDLLASELVYSNTAIPVSVLAENFAMHPAVLAIDKKIAASKTGISLAEQQYQPEWGVNASYGYRDDDPVGNSRADFFSLGISFDLPLFNENRQDMTVKSAISNSEAIKTEKVLLLRQLLAAFSSAKARLLRINKRKTLYQTKLLPQIHDQAEAALTAYTNDDGDFAEVVRSRIAVLNAEIEQLKILVEKQKLILSLNYLFVGSIAITQTTISAKNSPQNLTPRGEK
ncbi:TolC family protein [Colwelliaceae bacterium MEBiC 14330]